jgi:EAL domain-containing protein (putative c-di-GMP-specific phosphodiesterase class I)
VTPYNRVVLLVGRAAILACLTIAAVFVVTNASGVALQADRAAAGVMQRLGDELLVDVRGQQDALDDYILSQDPAALARYRQAVIAETRNADGIAAGSGGLAGVAAALAAVDAENDTWRAAIADPAIAAMQSGSDTAVTEASQIRIQDEETSQVVSSQLLRAIDAAAADLDARSEALSQLRIEATGAGLAVELVAAFLSLWFVRRYGQSVSRDARRRTQASAERVEIIASLRSLRIQPTPEATAAVMAEAMLRLPGVDVAGVFECTPNGLLALATIGLAGFPVRTGDIVPERHARYLRERSGHGPWADRVVRPAEPNSYDDSLAALGIKSRAFAPIRASGELIGLIGLSTTDEDHARHLIEDLPAVGEFASVAEAILAPDLVARRDRMTGRRRVTDAIASVAFRPVFQPIIELATGATVGFEALTRFEDGSRPDLVFAAAVDCGMGIELELVTLEAALRDARQLPADAWLSLNVSPALLAKGGGTLANMLTVSTRPCVLEVTEHDSIEAYAPLREAIVRLGPGIRLAVDDAGAGVANFNHLVELRPDFVKIDVGLVRGVENDPGRQAVVAGLVHFAARTGCQVLAEGIETEAERAMVLDLGVTLGQGYLLAMPAPIERWSLPAARADHVMLPA